MLVQRLRASESITGHVFPERWTSNSVRHMFNRVLVHEGLDGRNHRGEKLVIHSLRHFYATTLVGSGADPATVRDLLGHASIVTTNRYLNSPRGELFSAVGSAFARVTKHVTDSTGFERFPAEIGKVNE